MNDSTNSFSFSSDFRIDILCVDDKDCIDIEYPACDISKPDWFQNNGEGFILVGKKEEETFTIKVHKKCKLRISFRSPDVRIQKTRVPLQVVYKSITVDGKKLNTTPIICWHDVPYIYNLDCDKPGNIVIEIVQEPYTYTKQEFINALLSVNSKYIEDRVDEFFSDLKFQLQMNKIENF